MVPKKCDRHKAPWACSKVCDHQLQSSGVAAGGCKSRGPGHILWRRTRTGDPGDSERKRRWLRTLGNEVFGALYLIFSCAYRIGKGRTGKEKERKQNRGRAGKGAATTRKGESSKNVKFFEGEAAEEKGFPLFPEPHHPLSCKERYPPTPHGGNGGLRLT